MSDQPQVFTDARGLKYLVDETGVPWVEVDGAWVPTEFGDVGEVREPSFQDLEAATLAIPPEDRVKVLNAMRDEGDLDLNDHGARMRFYRAQLEAHDPDAGEPEAWLAFVDGLPQDPPDQRQQEERSDE